MDAVYVAPLLYLEEVVQHINNLPNFSWLQSLILGSKLHIDWSIWQYVWCMQEGDMAVIVCRGRG